VPHNTTIALVTAVIHHQRPSHDSGQRPAGSAQGPTVPFTGGGLGHHEL